MKAGGTEEDQGGARRRLPKLKIPAKIWKNRKQQNNNKDNEVDCVEEVQQEVQQEKEEQLEDISRRLIIREEELFSQDSPSEEEEDQLQKDFEDLRLQICMAIHNTFTPSSSTEHLEVLRSAVASIQQQEVQDRRWVDCSQDQVPRWRPQKCLSTHNILLQNMVESRLTKVAEDDSSGGDKLSSAVKRQVCRMGKCVKEDLLSVVRTIKDCYPPQMDILNVYAGLYHRSFSARLTELAASGLETEDCSYLLFWVNHYYPHEILKHEELDGQIKTACLGSLLLKGDLNRLEEQYLVHKEDKVKLWLNTALKKEEESWLNGRTPELIDCYYFSPLAVDVIQVTDSSLTEFNCAIKDQSKTKRLTVHLENFLCRCV
uniref:Tumor necrosis factor alpha-induced protein 2-like n=1 Tax=Amphiprion ocellaris TaxID=80972 RepID=A0AAQ5YIL5_AMPOC